MACPTLLVSRALNWDPQNFNKSYSQMPIWTSNPPWPSGFRIPNGHMGFESLGPYGLRIFQGHMDFEAPMASWTSNPP